MGKYIGIDIGGTSIQGGLVDNGKLEIEVKVPTSNNKNEILADTELVINKLISEDIDGIGVITAGTVDIRTGEVLTIGGNIVNWKGTKIRKHLASKFNDIPIFVDNDANGAGLCEMKLGAGKGYSNAIVVTLGTGLGGFLYQDNKIIRGARYRAGELGHIMLYPGGRSCICGQKGCAEKYVSGTGLELNYQELTGERIPGQEIILMDTKNKKKAVNKFIEDLGYFLVSVKNFYDPEIIIIGGGVVESSDYFWDKMIQSYEKKINALDDMKIVKAHYKSQAGIIGAALGVENEINGNN